jgi:D-aminopeptidase
MKRSAFVFLLLLFLLMGQQVSPAQDAKRPRARDAGVIVGVLPTGPLNAITDVAGVSIGHNTIIRGDNVRTAMHGHPGHGIRSYNC